MATALSPSHPLTREQGPKLSIHERGQLMAIALLRGSGTKVGSTAQEADTGFLKQ